MTKTKTVTEQTIHGSIEYDVVECDSCGQDVMEDEANEFTIGDREGYACDVCKDEGPVSFPPEQTEEYPFFTLALFSLFWPLVHMVVMESALDKGVREKDVIWFASAVGAIFWMGCLYLATMGGLL